MKRSLFFPVVAVALAIACAVLGFKLIQLRADFTRLRAELDRLTAENQRLAVVEKTPAATGTQPSAELLRLRGDVSRLTQQLKANQKIVEATPAVTDDSPETQAAWEEFNRTSAKRVLIAMSWADAFREYSQKNSGKFPGTFVDSVEYLTPESRSKMIGTTNLFEIINSKAASGSGVDTETQEDVILLKERQAWQNHEGMWGRIYAFQNGGARPVFMNSVAALEKWEIEHSPISTP